MSKNVVAVVEKHIEKGILGLAAVFLGAMLWMYFIDSPNQVQFGNEKLGPAELNRAIEESARQLDSAIKSAKPGPGDSEKFSTVLTESIKEGIFAKAAPAPKPADGAATPAAPRIAVRDTLRPATSGGTPIIIPGEEEKKDAVAVNMVKPLAPLDVQASTGISMVLSKPRKLGETPAPVAAATPGKDAKAPEPVELAWVTVGGYFDKRAQENDTAKALYDASRRKFYLAGMDVERREVLASGEWSEWQLIEESKANPEFKIPKPIVKEDGSILNRKEIDEAWSIVKRAQPDLMQPAFAEVQAGDKWRNPHDEPEVIEEDATAPRARAPKPPKPTNRGFTQPQPSGGGRGFGGGSGGGGRFGGGGDGVVGGGITPGGGAQNDPKARDAARKTAREDLDKAKKAMSDKDYPAAMSSAQQVVNNEHANDNQKRQAQSILDDAQAKMDAANAATGGGAIGRGGGMGIASEGGTVTLGPGRGFTGMQAAATPAQATASPLVTSDAGAPAVWFHDDTVQPGKTYQYRMRVRMWNRYLGQIRSVATAEDAKRAYLEGEWSAPTNPITVAPRTHFFVKGMKPDASGALVEVWTLRKGNWVKQNFEVNIGDVIGGERMMEPLADEKPAEGSAKKVAVNFATNAIVLDLRVAKKFPFRNAGKNHGFQWNDRESLVLTYLDPADGQVKERYQALDQYDAIRKMLLSKEKGDA